MLAKTFPKAVLTISLFLVVLSVSATAHAKIIYVDDDAAGTNDGSSWADAYNYLQNALASANDGDEVRVAQGIYKPDQGAGIIPGDREATFQLINGVTVKGGFAGFGATDPNVCDIQLYETILTGDLNRNDRDVNDPYNMLDEPCRAENSYHVVTVLATDTTAMLDGFIISGGNANGSYSNNGGGLYNYGSHYGGPTLANCTFVGNSANYGGGIYNESEDYDIEGNLTLNNCTFSNNLANCGGGIYSFSGYDRGPVMTNCRFIGNSANDSGGGMYNDHSSPSLIFCTFSDNSAAYKGGGMHNRDNVYPTLTNCKFIGNFACYGGGMHNGMATCIPILTDCIFSGNYASADGGGICSSFGSSCPTLINCTFSGNLAGGSGGGMYGSECPVNNCIFWGNKDGSGMTESAQIGDSDWLYVNYSCIQGWSGYLGGIGTTGRNPLFVDPDGDDNIIGTEDDNLRLLPGSPCIDAADNTKVPEPVVIDLNGNPRFIDDVATVDTGNPPSADAIVDMGAYESLPNQGFSLNTRSVIVPEGAIATLAVALLMDPNGKLEAKVAFESGDVDITVETGETLTFNSSNYLEPQAVTFAAAEDSDYYKGVTLIRISSPGCVPAVITATEEDNEPTPTVLLVDARAATGDHDGSSWPDAFTDLQQALTVAAAHTDVEEIHVGQGLYMPAEPSSGDLIATFQLINGVTIRGGYAGFGEPKPNARDIELYETILTGANKFYHVVTGNGTDANAILDGFNITAGNANGPSSNNNHRGAGMYNEHGSPTITNCIFIANKADYGGGMHNCDNSSPTLTNCAFTKNSAIHGAGMNNIDSHPTLNNCTFSENSSSGGGGGMYNVRSSPSLINCLFIDNYARYAGGMSYFESSPILTNSAFIRNRAESSGGGMSGGSMFGECKPVLINCIFSDNSAESGGGMFNGNHSRPTIINCTFTNNSADNEGGGMHNHANKPTITGCVFSGNTVDNYGGGGIYSDSSDMTITNCTFVANEGGTYGGGGMHNHAWGSSNIAVNNCIFWANTSFLGPQIMITKGLHAPEVVTLTLDYSDVQGLTVGVYVGSGCHLYWGDGNIDSNPLFVDLAIGNYHLSELSPCINTGDPNYVADPNEKDLDGKPRIIGDRVDMGAYEYAKFVQAEAKIVPRTLNLASRVKWINCHIRLLGDYNVADMDPESILLEDEIEAESVRVDEKQVATARFTREDVQAILDIGEVELTITGRLTDETVFEAADTIKVIDKAGKN